MKPQNILVGAPSDARPGPKLVDFGIAAVGAAAGVSAMTPDFAAPEVLGRGDEGPWSDLYALGATAWWLCCGVPRAERAEFRPRFPVSPELEGWLRWLCSHRPADRPARAARALEELRRLPAPPEVQRPSPGTWDESAEPPRALATHPRRSPASLRLLPLRTPPVVGRAADLAELNRWTTSGEPQVCVLTGVRGSGRRHLARAFAAAAAERDSAWVVPIDPSGPCPLTAALRAARHPELTATTEEDAFEALARFTVSADRPVVAVVQPGPDGEPVNLVTRLALVRGLRILTVASTAAGHPGWRTLELGPVDPYELGRRLGLQAGLTERLAVVAHGHPGTTLDLVGELARSGRLTADSSGIGLAVDAPLAPPPEPAARARAAVADLPSSGSVSAAALLRPLPGDVWRALLGTLGLEHDDAAAAWSRAGLVRQVDGVPGFDDPAVRVVVADAVPAADRARIFSAAAAATADRPELDAEHAEWACEQASPASASRPTASRSRRTWATCPARWRTWSRCPIRGRR